MFCIALSNSFVYCILRLLAKPAQVLGLGFPGPQFRPGDHSLDAQQRDARFNNPQDDGDVKTAISMCGAWRKAINAGLLYDAVQL